MPSFPTTATATIRRIWSEFVSYEVLASRQVLDLLRPRHIQVLVAVTPPQLDSIGALATTYRDAGIPMGVWPMLDDTDGRWGSTFNAQIYADFVLQVLDRCPPKVTVAIDLEPPIAILRALVAGRLLSVREFLRSHQRQDGLRALRMLVAELGSRGCLTLAAVHPILLADHKEQSGWQWLLGTPVDSMGFDAVSPMAYTSLIEGYSRGLLPRHAARTLLTQSAQAARMQFGEAASVSLGTVGIGALGDERPYRDLHELRQDVAAVCACGVDDLALFDLAGVLGKEEPRVWLDAFVETTAADHRLERSSLRSRALGRTLQGASRSIGLYQRWLKNSHDPS